MSWLFEPSGDGVARNPKGADQTAQAGALVVSAQNLLFGRLVIGLGARLLGRTAPASTTLVALFAVAGATMTNQLVARTMVTWNNLCGHTWSLI